MAQPISRLRRVLTVLRWPVGAALALWRYLWRTSPVNRRELSGDRSDLGPDLGAEDGPSGGSSLQPPREGVGPLFHRRYRVDIAGGDHSPEDLMTEIMSNPNRASPIEVAIFRKTKGDDGAMTVGDEYVVRMPGPWDAPVRVVDRSATSFRFATLEGHIEAGQIEFRASPGDGDRIRFEIESWARSADSLSRLLYVRMHLAKEMQLHMWTHFCERVAKLANGHIAGAIDVDTRVVSNPTDRR